jgi:cytochrome bd-type quinol oxidase subunit 2
MPVLIIVFVFISILFSFFIVPKMTTDIAVNEGFDRGKWIFYCIILNIFSLIWLYTILDSNKSREKKLIIILVLIYFCIFFGAYSIDKYTGF